MYRVVPLRKDQRVDRQEGANGGQAARPPGCSCGQVIVGLHQHPQPRMWQAWLSFHGTLYDRLYMSSTGVCIVSNLHGLPVREAIGQQHGVRRK